MMNPVRFVSILLISVLLSPPIHAAPITLSSLLDEMTDVNAVARWPEPPYVTRQSSSYDRRSTTPTDPNTWFANYDYAQFQHVENGHKRTEYVLHDAAGPGCIVRIWITDFKPDGIMRFYIDGAEQPVIEERADRLLSGKALIGEPLSANCQKGLNLYLPIPYATHCVVTYEKPNNYLYYHVDYRTYPRGTQVESFSKIVFNDSKSKIEEVQKRLLSRDDSQEAAIRLEVTEKTFSSDFYEQEVTLTGPAAIRTFSIKFQADDMPAALRSTMLLMNCDGEGTIWCPLGDFFGSGVGANAFKDWWRKVEKNGEMSCRWVMPFQKECRIRLINVGHQKFRAAMKLYSMPWQWDDRSMYFHANWRQESPIDTTKFKDWNYVTIKGQGVYVGDTLAVYNPVTDWWGEGDEKIFVDGESMPSHIGTGTEDYYGYAFCTPKWFESPFHAQPRADGPSNFGHTTNTRVRLLDGIPFEKSLQFDMEIWHCAPHVEVSYAAATYWYGRPGAMSNRKPELTTAVVAVTATPKQFKLPDVIECEDLQAASKVKGGLNIEENALSILSNSKQLRWSGAHDGDKLSLKLPVTKAGTYNLWLSFTVSDASCFQIYLDDRPFGSVISGHDFDRPLFQKVKIGTCEFTEGDHVLAFQFLGSFDGNAPSHSLELDYLQLESSH